METRRIEQDYAVAEESGVGGNTFPYDFEVPHVREILKSCGSFRVVIDLIDEKKLSSKVALDDLLATTTIERWIVNLDSVVAELKRECDRLERAIVALVGRVESGVVGARKTMGGKPKASRRPMSAASRKRISIAMKRQWARRKKA